MLAWVVVFLGLAAVAAVFAFSGISAFSAGIAQILFFTFLGLSGGAAVLGVLQGDDP